MEVFIDDGRWLRQPKVGVQGLAIAAAGEPSASAPASSAPAASAPAAIAPAPSSLATKPSK